MRKKNAGATVVEAMVVLAVFGLIVGVAAPNLFELSSGYRLHLGAHELRAVLHRAKAYAIYHAAKVGVKFFVEDDRVFFAIYKDGDGDGVRTRDIESGVDPQVTPTRRFLYLGADVRFGFPPGKSPRDPGAPRRRLRRLWDPIRFNRSDLASFGPLGGSTPGSLYLTDGKRLQAVRVYGRTGKIKVIRYNFAKEVWEQ